MARGLLTFAVIAVAFGSVVSVLWIGASDVMVGDMTAGDLGAFKSIKNPTYHKVGNITLIASGMGARYRDNCIDVKLMQNGDIEFEIISLQEDLDFDDLEDYNLEN